MPVTQEKGYPKTDENVVMAITKNTIRPWRTEAISLAPHYQPAYSTPKRQGPGAEGNRGSP